jgi:D-alanyl-D-alanine carboxypeptidase
MTLATPPRPIGRVQVPRIQGAAALHRHWYWLGAGLVLVFLIPFGLTDVLSIDRDLYYGVYMGAVFAFFGAWLRSGNTSMRAVLSRNWRAGVVLGALFAGVMVAIVLREPATGHPDGLRFAAAIVWRGVLYGFADGLILSAFPILAVFAIFAGTRALTRRRGKAAVGALALGVSLLFTAVYHLGYSDFRSAKLRKPIAGDVIWSIPTLATLSPLGAPIAHAGLHVSAVVHSYETDVFLPPHEAALDPAAFERILDPLVAGPDRLAPGATAYVAGPAGSWTGAVGLADVRTKASMEADARMRLESVSKIWTATLVHQLAEDGSLSLSDTVARWLPGLLPDGSRITIRQLLTHTSGLIDNNDVIRAPDSFIARVTDPDLRARLLDVARRLEQNPALEFSPRLWIELAAYQPLLAPPGTQYHYSNIGFEILGLIAARAGGQSIDTLYDERIFEPLGLRASAYDPQGPIEGDHARGYGLAGGRLTDATAAHPGVGAEGGIVSNAPETARFLVALMRGELLGPAQLAQLKGDGFWRGGTQTGCGGVAYGHSGGGAGFKTDVWVSGDGSRVAVLLLNGRGDGVSDERAGAAMRSLYCATREVER